MIVGGPAVIATTNYPVDFRLYTWSGDRNQNAQQLSAEMRGLNPEALVELPPAPWSSSSVVQLISDNGRTDFYGDGVEAKHLPELNFKKSRSDWVQLGSIVKPAPIIVRSALFLNGISITWRSLKGEQYRLQYSFSLDEGSWSDVPGDVLAAGPYASKDDDQPFASQCFYRVIVLP
jgi:hypothetical protein